MMISTRGRYALRVMLHLAEHSGEGYISLNDIAEQQSISKKYLEQIIPALTRAGMLRAGRGLRGGYRLASAPAAYTVGAILRAAEGPLAPVACMAQSPNVCERRAFCRTLPVWEGLDRVVNDYLDGITLQDVLESADRGAAEKSGL